MASDNFGLRIGLEGEKEFKKGSGRYQRLLQGAGLGDEARCLVVR